MTLIRRSTTSPRLRLTQASLIDWLLGALGFTMATASASFAGYMIVTAPPEVTGSGSRDFNIFVQWDRRTPPGPGHAPAERDPAATASAAPSPPAGPDATADAGIDTLPTGSIPAEAGLARETRPADLGRVGTRLREFHVRDVFDGRALIEHRSHLSLVQPGSILAGAGEVLAIERQGGVWIVRTAAGVIGGS